MNIILIMSDTFRRDHLGYYGDVSIRTPYLDQFSKSCVKFNNCYTASFPTLPNRADLFTGKYTFTYLGWAPLPREEKNILAEVLQRAGYTTIATVDVPFLVRNGYCYDRGFEDFVWASGQGLERPRINSERRFEEDYCAPKTMMAAERCLEYYHKEKFFLYVDTWDPHEPWDPPYWYTRQYYSSYDGQPCAYPCYWDWCETGLKQEDITLAHACYCGEITMVDRWIGRLLDKVKALGIWEDTAILFTSDHGFYFGEHGYFGKSREKGRGSRVQGWWYRSPLYQEITRIPLLIYVPGMKPTEAEAMVSSVDIMPTILELAGVEIPDSVQGKSLVPLLKGKSGHLRDFVVTSLPLYKPGEKTRIVDDWERKIKEPQPSTITTEEWTLLYSNASSPAELYNTKDDPTQSNNIIFENWETAKDLHHRFVSLLEQLGTDESNLNSRSHLKKN